MINKISGRIVTHEKDFLGTVEWDSKTGLILGVREHAELFWNTRPKEDEIRFDPTETVIFPGFGDIHIHAREDESGKHIYKEDFIPRVRQQSMAELFTLQICRIIQSLL